MIKKVNIKLPESLFVEAESALLAQAVHTEQKRGRIRRAHTKERAEVRGGGRKPWKQKGTGRARHASIRSPIWVGGGTTFGPRTRKERVVSLPSAMARKALCGAFALQAKRKTLEFVEMGDKASDKTSAAAKVFSKPGTLLLLDESHKDSARAVRNLRNVKVSLASRVTAGQVLAAQRVWVDTASLPTLEKRCK